MLSRAIKPNRGRAKRARRGFTLIEMIVATLLLAIGAAAALGCISGATRYTAVSADYTTASLLAQQRFAELEAVPENITAGEQNGDFGQDYPNFAWTQNVESSSVEGVMRVTVTVAWPDGTGQRSADFVTYEMTTTSAASQTGAAGAGGAAGETGGG